MEEEKDFKSKIESLMFVSGKPVSFKRLAQVSRLDIEKVKALVSDLQKDYQESQKGIRLITQTSSVQMVSAPESGEVVKGFLTYELQESLHHLFHIPIP